MHLCPPPPTPPNASVRVDSQCKMCACVLALDCLTAFAMVHMFGSCQSCPVTVWREEGRRARVEGQGGVEIIHFPESRMKESLDIKRLWASVA